MPVLTAIFLFITTAASVTGLFFHRDHVLLSHILGALSLLLLALAPYALCLRELNGGGRGVYVGCAVAALYFNVFVLIIQSFRKISASHVLAPTQSAEPPIAGAQGAALLSCAGIGILSFGRFRPASVP